MIKVEAVIFDKDGTLNNSAAVMPILAESRVAQLIKHLPWAENLVEQLAEAIGLRGAVIDPHSPMMVGSRQETVAAAATILYLSRQIGWEQAVKVTGMAFIEGDNMVAPEQKTALFPGVRELFTAINQSGGKIALATNDIRISTEAFLAHSGLDTEVYAFACADEVSHGKPAPDLALLAAKRLKVDPAECLLVGDSVFDMEMGKLAGVKKTAGVLSGSAKRPELAALADFVIESIKDIHCP